MKKMIVLLQSAFVLCALLLTGCGEGQVDAATPSLSTTESQVASGGSSSEQSTANAEDVAGADDTTDIELDDAIVYEGVIAEIGEGTIGLQRIESTYGEDGIDAAAGGFDTPVDIFMISADIEISVRNVSRETEEVTISNGSTSDLIVGSTAYVFYKHESEEQLALQVTVVNIY